MILIPNEDDMDDEYDDTYDIIIHCKSAEDQEEIFTQLKLLNKVSKLDPLIEQIKANNNNVNVDPIIKIITNYFKES